jgi:hypothetical protein
MQREKRKLLDILPEVQSALANTVKGWDGILTGAKNKLKKDLEKGKRFPLGVETIDISKIWIDYSVQRDIKHKHVAKIIERFDPRICMPAAGVKLLGSDEQDRIYVYDGQHRLMTCAILGIKEIQVCVIETTEKTFPAYAFEVCNDSGIAKASKEDIHRTLLYRWEHGTEEEREDPRVRKAHKIQTVFDDCDVDLEGQRIRKSDKLKGSRPHFFSHFQYAHFGYDEIGMTEMKKVLNAIRTVYNDEEEIDQGLYIGLVDMVRIAKAEQDLEDLPEGWMEKVLTVIKRATGNAKNFTQCTREQWQHHNGTSMEGPKGMCNTMREVFKKFHAKEEYVNVPHHQNTKVGILDENVCARFEAMLAGQTV